MSSTQSKDALLQKLRATFSAEAEEHLDGIASGLVEVERRADAAQRRELVETVFRRAHSLKGASRAVGLAGIESVCQAMEGMFASWKDGRIELTPERLDVLHRALDLIRSGIPAVDGAAAEIDLERCHALGRELADLSMLPEGELRMRSRAAAPAPAAGAAVAPERERAPVAAGVKSATIRISADKLDQLILRAEELLSVKCSAERLASELRDLQPGIERCRAEWARIRRRGPAAGAGLGLRPRGQALEAGAASGHEVGLELLDRTAEHLKWLEDRVQSLGRKAERDCAAAAGRVDELLADSKRLLMQPFSSLSDGFPKLVRDLCRDQDKAADLVVKGGDALIDKRILEAMRDPLMHLLRNCVDHGVEPTAVRTERGKAPRATITISVARVHGSRVEILVADDGAGIDLERIRDAALRRGLVSPDRVNRLDSAHVLEWVFESGFSTRSNVTEVSGRGLGLAIVREKARKLGGQATVETQPGAGTSFRIVLPETLSTFQGVLVRVSEQLFVLPAANVERVARVEAARVNTVENRDTISLENRVVALARLGSVLGLAERGLPAGGGEDLSVVVAISGEERMAFAVDEILGEQEVLAKKIAKPLSRVRHVSGATVLGSGQLVPVLDVSDLIRSGRASAPAALPAESAGARSGGTQTRRRRILVAEDSITSRMLLKHILESAGHEVKTAVDGMEALAELRAGEFDLVVSDLEMPRMNGFDLTARIRADQKLGSLPVILVTALASREDRERGLEAGASAYLVKSQFDQGDLLEAVRRFVS